MNCNTKDCSRCIHAVLAGHLENPTERTPVFECSQESCTFEEDEDFKQEHIYDPNDDQSQNAIRIHLTHFQEKWVGQVTGSQSSLHSEALVTKQQYSSTLSTTKKGNNMRTLREIVKSVKDNQPVSTEELRYSIMVLHSLLQEEYSWTQELAKRIGVNGLVTINCQARMSTWRIQKAFDKSPEEYIEGPNRKESQ